MAMFESFADEIKAEYHMTEPRMRLTLTPVPAPDTVFAASSQQALIGALMGVACGVLAMSQTVKGLVETSTNLASVKEPQTGSVVITTSQRSSVDSAKEYAMLMVESVFRLAGAEVAHSDGYPGGHQTLSRFCCAARRSVISGCSAVRPRCVPFMPALNADSSSRSIPIWRWCRSALRCAACIRPTSGSR